MTNMSALNEQENVARAFIAARAEKTPLTEYPGVMPATMAEAYKIQDHAIALYHHDAGGTARGRFETERTAAREKVEARAPFEALTEPIEERLANTIRRRPQDWPMLQPFFGPLELSR